MGRRQSGLVPSGRGGFEGQEDLMLTPAPFYAPYITCPPALPPPACPGQFSFQPPRWSALHRVRRGIFIECTDTLLICSKNL